MALVATLPIASQSASLDPAPDQFGPDPVFVAVKPTPDFDKEILTPLRAKQAAEQAAIDEANARQAALEAARAALVVKPIASIPQPVFAAYSASGTLTGSLGYALAYGNCVDEPGVNNPHNGTNPSDWPSLYSEPFIGATFLYWGNHTGVVTGLWSNGDVEVRHRNWQGAPRTRFPRSAFRGYR